MCPPWASPSSSAPHASQWQGPYHARELKRAGLLSKGGIHGMQSRAERGSQSSTGNPWGKVCHVSVICGSRTSIQLSGGAMCGTATQPGFRLSQLSSPLTLKILYSLPLYPLPHRSTAWHLFFLSPIPAPPTAKVPNKPNLSAHHHLPSPGLSYTPCTPRALNESSLTFVLWLFGLR